MFTYLSRRGTRPRTTTRLRRITAALAAVTGGLLAWAAAVPAASAATILIPDPGGGVRAGPRHPGCPGPGDRGRRHARLADHPHRGRCRPGRGHRRGGPGPHPGQPPVRLRYRITPRRADLTRLAVQAGPA